MSALERPVDGIGLGLFRAAFGALMAIGLVRYAANGWITTQLTGPAFHFTWPHFEWIRPLPGVGTPLLFAVMIACALLLAIGWWARPAALLFAALFTYTELIDVANYLNHYYLVSLVALLLAAVPCDRAFSVRRQPDPAVPIGAYHLLRAQYAIVWVYAGLAKLDGDWLLRAEPLATWLSARGHLPVIGPLLTLDATAYLMSWAGAAFDLTIPLLLLGRRTRKAAFVAAVVFHLMTWALFPIGVFAPLMLLGATLFFAPDWPRRRPVTLAPAPRPISRLARVAAALYLTVQLALPLRHLLYPGDVNWGEQGFRFAWRVMLTHKTGRVEYRVVADGVARTHQPTDDLTALQHEQMVTQPDLIHAYALDLAARMRAAGHRAVEVYADAWVSLNGRPAARIIDPTVDLAATPRPLWAPVDYIEPL